MMIKIPRSPLALAAAALLAFSAAACGGDDDDAGEGATTEASGASGTDTTAGAPADTDGSDTTAAGTDAEPSGEAATLRLAYFPNVTHAPAIIGVETGLFQEALGANVNLELTTFNSGTEAIEALFAGAIDASFIGPNPAINGFAQSQSDGGALRIVSGTTSGGASLVVREGIDAPEDLADTTLASPSLGNTQDVALRAWLQEQGYATDTSGGGDVSVTPLENPDILAAFQQGSLDGAWVPEPWATRLINEGGGHVLVNEADLWPDGQFVTTHLIVATRYLEEHPDVVKGLITGLGQAIDEANADAEGSQQIVNDGIENVTTSRLDDATISGAWENLEFTLDPVASSLQESADDAIAVELLEPVELDGIYDLTLLDEVLAERGDEEVSGL
jgi:NitT/TauT family transport system substrate-binding protein